MNSDDNKTKKSKDPSSQLLDRLAKGAKSIVSKKEMLALTTKNYNLLPEIQRKKNEKKKVDDIKERQRKVKEMDAVSLFLLII